MVISTEKSKTDNHWRTITFPIFSPPWPLKRNGLHNCDTAQTVHTHNNTVITLPSSPLALPMLSASKETMDIDLSAAGCSNNMPIFMPKNCFFSARVVSCSSLFPF